MSVSRWYNNTGPSAPAATPAAPGRNNLDQTLGTGASLAQSALTIGAGIAAIRQQSGAAAERQRRIAACGRRPLVGIGRRFRERKEAYRKCVANLDTAPIAEDKGLVNQFGPPPPIDSDNKTLMFVGIGVGILIVGTIAYLAFKKK